MTTSDRQAIRVARVIARTNVGGPSLQITALMRGLGQHGFEQELYRGSVDVGEADYLDLRAPDVPSTNVPGLGRSVRLADDLRVLWFLIRAFHELRPLIVHTHTAKAGVLGRIAGLVTRVPVRVHTFHGHVLDGYFQPAVTRLVVVVERILERFTTHTVAVGGQVLNDLSRVGIARPGRSSIIAPGVRKPAEINRADACAIVGLPHDHRLNVLFVGRLTTIKRTERFIQMALSLLGSDLPACFIVVGDGPRRTELERLANGHPNLTFTGWQRDMAAVYAAADLIVLTSDNEGMPVALIEAAMQGVPAVSTDVGAVRQVVADGTTGLVVAVDDAVGLEAAVRTMCSDTALRCEMGAAAARRASDLFGEDRLVSDYAALYIRLITELPERRRRRLD